MSASTAKASRREIRRAFGDSAATMLQQSTHQVSNLALAIESTRVGHDRLTRQVALLEPRVDALAAVQQRVLGASLWGRLRWLMRGR